MSFVDIVVPPEQEGTKAVVRAWLKKVGDTVSADDPLVELETDKVTQEVPSPGAGVLHEILLDRDAEALPGALLGRLSTEVAQRKVLPLDGELGGGGVDEARDYSGHSTTTQPLPIEGRVSSLALSPAVRRAVREHGVDPSVIAGTGRGGRVTRGDVDKFVAGRAQPVSSGGTRSIPHDRMRLAIAQNMLGSVTTAPHVTAIFEADFSAIMAHRRAHKGEFEKAGTSLTFTAYFVAAAAAAMKVAPAINSRWFEDRLEIYDRVNVGVGTALGEKGLVVPVVQGAEGLSLLEIATALGDLVGRARGDKLTTADVRGGTFTISNHGVSGSLLATPIIINQPQSATLGIGKTEKRVVVREVEGVDTIQIRPMAYVSLTIDHRVVDGHQTNAWLAKFVETIEGWPL